MRLSEKIYSIRSSAVRAARKARLADGEFRIEHDGSGYFPVKTGAAEALSGGGQGTAAPAAGSHGSGEAADAVLAKGRVPENGSHAAMARPALSAKVEILVNAILEGPKTHRELCALIGWSACRPYLLSSAARAGVAVVVQKVGRGREVTYRGVL
jgi:hypothetical protein